MATQVKTGLIANDAITDAKIANVALTGVTASSGDSSTSLATTAFVATEINSLIDSAPGALNTLNELAAAMGDDANFSTTVTNSIATKLPLAGGTLTGDLNLTSAISNAPKLRITNTNADGSSPQLILKKDSASPADGDEVGRIYMYGDDDAGNSTEAFLAIGKMTDVSDGSEDSSLDMYTYAAGTQVKTLILKEGKVAIGGVMYATRFSVGKTPSRTPGSVFTSSPSSFFSESTLGNSKGDAQKIVTFAGEDQTNVSGLALYRYRRVAGTNWTGDGFSFRQEVDNTANLYDYMNFAGGKVGIGTVTPDEFDGRANNLVVQDTGDGGITIVSGDNSDARIAFTIAADTGLSNGAIHYDNDTDKFHFSTGGSDRMYIDSSGNVGIGTGANTPGKKLDVTVTGNTDGIRVNGNQANTSLILNNTGNNGLAWDITSTGANHGYGEGDLNFSQGFGVPKVQMKSSGLVNFGNQTDYISLNGSNGIINRVKTGSGNADIRFQLDGADYMQLKDSAAPGILSLGYMSATSNNSMVAIHGLGNDTALVVSNTALTGSSSSYGWAGRGGRVLHSNGTGWVGDGSDPALVLGSSNSGGNRSGIGLLLHNESPNDDQYSPMIAFGNKSNSGSYNTAYATILGKKTGQGQDGNWSIGEIHIDTAGARSGSNSRNNYMDDDPAFRMDSSGDLTMPYRSYAYGQWSGSSFSVTNGTGFPMNVLRSQNMTYQTNATHGAGITVQKPGLYKMVATGLYDPGGTYVYVGWCVNGNQLHHWHSNHTISNNHDYVSIVMRQLNVGDHITFENASQVMTAAWGGGHSSWYIVKFG